MPLQTRKTKKDGRKRTYSLVSSNMSTKAGSVASSRSAEKSSPSQQGNASRQTLESHAVPVSPPQVPAEPMKQVPNVFEFLEQSENSSSDSSTSESESGADSESDEEPELPRAVQTTKIQSPKPRANTVPHGVLVSGGNKPPKKVTQFSPVHKTPIESRKPRPEPAPAAGNQLVSQKKQSNRKPSPISTADISPSGKGQLALSRQQTYHGSPRGTDPVHRPPLPPSPPRSPEDILHRTTPTKRRDSSASQVPFGYGLLASHLTKSASEESGGFSPLYRRFETVNHRVLLHLQDEISQMEEDLHVLDEYEEMHRVSIAEQEGTKPLPASRRRDAQSQVYSSLHYRRMDLMSALIQKTEQYSKPLSISIF